MISFSSLNRCCTLEQQLWSCEVWCHRILVLQKVQQCWFLLSAPVEAFPCISSCCLEMNQTKTLGIFQIIVKLKKKWDNILLLEGLILGSGTQHSKAMQRVNTLLLMSVFLKLDSLCPLINAEKLVSYRRSCLGATGRTTKECISETNLFGRTSCCFWQTLVSLVFFFVNVVAQISCYLFLYWLSSFYIPFLTDTPWHNYGIAPLHPDHRLLWN